MNCKKVLIIFSINAAIGIAWYVLGAFYWLSWDITKWSCEPLRIFWSFFLIAPICVVNCNAKIIIRWFE